MENNIENGSALQNRTESKKCSRERSSPSCCLCSCLKSRPADDMEMGYLPANITVNQGALRQGVPDIFLRRDSQSGRISMEAPPQSGISFRISKDSESDGQETSGTWAEFLRRATLRRSGRNKSYGTYNCTTSEAPAEDGDSTNVVVSESCLSIGEEGVSGTSGLSTSPIPRWHNASPSSSWNPSVSSGDGLHYGVASPGVDSDVFEKEMAVLEHRRKISRIASD